MLSKDFLLSLAISLIFSKIILTVDSCEIDTFVLGDKEPLFLTKFGRKHSFKIPEDGRIRLEPYESVWLGCTTDPYRKLSIK